jgi:hypothetical protein
MHSHAQTGEAPFLFAICAPLKNVSASSCRRRSATSPLWKGDRKVYIRRLRQCCHPEIATVTEEGLAW